MQNVINTVTSQSKCNQYDYIWGLVNDDDDEDEDDDENRSIEARAYATRA